ncbi:hypothetical protein FACS1894126_1540 [Alphaproteobacteria bacterium]|nr:hypothetical protein FACS1894126_1540 [Alphaproteobacteria bacterium]
MVVNPREFRLIGANADKSEFSNALNKKYCIKFPHPPSKINIRNSDNVGSTQKYTVGIKVRVAAIEAKYSSIPTLFSLMITIFFIIMSCSAKNSAAVSGMRYSQLMETVIMSLLYNVINVIPENPINVANAMRFVTFSFKI